MKKFVCILLCFVFVISVGATGAFAAETELLTEIGRIDVDINAGYGVGFTCDGKKYDLDDTTLDEAALEYLLEVFSDENLTASDTVCEELIGYKDERLPKGGYFDIVTKDENVNYKFYFDNKIVLVQAYVPFEGKQYQGFFEYKNKAVYDELVEFLCEAVKAEETEEPTEKPTEKPTEAEKDDRENLLEISNFEIIYTGEFYLEDFDESFEWGVCEYSKDKEKVTAFYWVVAASKKATVVAISEEMGADNTVIFDLTDKDLRLLNVEEEKEYDVNFTILYDFEIQVNVSDRMKAESVVVRYKHKNETKMTEQKIDMEEYEQSGKLPKEFFDADDNAIEKPTEKVTETPTERETEKPTEEKKAEPTETVTEEATEAVTEFVDVPKEHWAYEAIMDFAQKEIVKGYGNGYFGVDDYVTYEHIAIMFDRLMGYESDNASAVPAIREDVIAEVVKALGIDVSDADEALLEKFSDCADIKDENVKYVAKAVELGLVVGFDGRLCPKDYITRGETMVLLSRALKHEGK